jgi:modulator of FtsH protease HflK
VQASAIDKERLRSPNMPEARGEVERVLQGAVAYREQSVAEANGQAARFLKFYERVQEGAGRQR